MSDVEAIMAATTRMLRDPTEQNYTHVIKMLTARGYHKGISKKVRAMEDLELSGRHDEAIAFFKKVNPALILSPTAAMLYGGALRSAGQTDAAETYAMAACTLGDVIGETGDGSPGRPYKLFAAADAGGFIELHLETGTVKSGAVEYGGQRLLVHVTEEGKQICFTAADLEELLGAR